MVRRGPNPPRFLGNPASLYRLLAARGGVGPRLEPGRILRSDFRGVGGGTPAHEKFLTEVCGREEAYRAPKVVLPSRLSAHTVPPPIRRAALSIALNYIEVTFHVFHKFR